MRRSPPALYKIAWLFSLVPLVVCLSACGQVMPSVSPSLVAEQTGTAYPPSATAARVQSNTPTQTPTPFSRLELDAEDLRGTIIHYWYIWSGEAGETMKELVDEFNLNNEWGIVVVPVSQDGLEGMSTSMKVALQSDAAPDLAVGYLHQALDWDENQAVVDQWIYVNDPIWGFSAEEQADFYSALCRVDRDFDCRFRYGHFWNAGGAHGGIFQRG